MAKAKIIPNRTNSIYSKENVNHLEIIEASGSPPKQNP